MIPPGCSLLVWSVWSLVASGSRKAAFRPANWLESTGYVWSNILQRGDFRLTWVNTRRGRQLRCTQCFHLHGFYSFNNKNVQHGQVSHSPWVNRNSIICRLGSRILDRLVSRRHLELIMNVSLSPLQPPPKRFRHSVSVLNSAIQVKL